MCWPATARFTKGRAGQGRLSRALSPAAATLQMLSPDSARVLRKSYCYAFNLLLRREVSGAKHSTPLPTLQLQGAQRVQERDGRWLVCGGLCTERAKMQTEKGRAHFVVVLTFLNNQRAHV